MVRPNVADAASEDGPAERGWCGERGMTLLYVSDAVNEDGSDVRGW